MSDKLTDILSQMQKDGKIAIDGDKVALKGSVPHSAMVFAFPDGSASFVNGFEAGMIWADIDREEPMIDRTAARLTFAGRGPRLSLVQSHD